MAESSEVTANAQALASEYNNLRKDVLDVTLGHEHLGGIAQGKLLFDLAVSENLQNSNDTEKTTNAQTYTKIKEVKIDCLMSVCRLKMDVKRPGGYDCRAKVYKNGVAIGTERIGGDGVYTTFSEDFATWAKNDLIQIYAYSVSGGGFLAYVRNMRFYYDRTVKQVLPVTNQDP